MNRKEVRGIVIAELMAVQAAIGVPIRQVTDQTRPLGDLEKFDSPVAEDTTAAILAKLGASPDTKCPFTKKEGGRCLTLDRVVDHFCKSIGIEETSYGS